jgi:hypothetical protein
MEKGTKHMLIKCPRCGDLYDDPDAEDENDVDQCCACDDELRESQEAHTTACEIARLQ